MKKIEMHFHTKETSQCGTIEAKEAIKMYKEANYNAVVVTDHFSEEALGSCEEKIWDEVVAKFLEGYNAAVLEGNQCGIKVYLGMEIRFLQNGSDYLVYGVTKDFLDRYPWIYVKTLEEFREICDIEGLCIIQAHPYRGGCIPADLRLLDGVEVHNANSQHDSHNEKALEWAQRDKLLQIVGSDFHRPADLSGNGILVENLPKNERELVQVIRSREYSISVN